MAYLALLEDDSDLLPVLRGCSSDDLEPLVEFVLSALSSELEGVPDFKLANPQYEPGKRILAGDHRKYADDIAAEIQKYGGNTVVNLMRGGKGVPYIEVLRDVADHLKIKYADGADAATLEGQIQLAVLQKAYEKMTPEEREELLKSLGVYAGAIPAALPVVAIQAAIKVGGFAAYRLALIIANAVARMILGHGLKLAANAAIARAMGVLAGPIGWAITVLWTILDIAGPAYRVTIPCVLHVAYLRQKKLVMTCKECGNDVSRQAKFCPECGAKIQ